MTPKLASPIFTSPRAASGPSAVVSRRRFKPALQLGAAAAITALVASGCGGDGGGGGDEESVFVQSIGPLPHLNPQFFISPAVRVAGSSMMEPLVKITDEYEIVPWLAHDWEISEDGMEITLHLEEGVEWHDGEPFTSEDVAFNLEEVIEYQYIAGDAAAAIESVETPDEHTAVIHFSEPYGPFFEMLAVQFMIPKHIYEGTDFLTNEANSAPIGTGPMVFEEFVEGERVEAVANENYWAGEVELDRIIFPVFADPNAQDLALLSGELDRGGVSASRYDEIDAAPELELSTRGSMQWMAFFNMNTDVEELQDPEVRQLVYSAIDRERVHEVAVPHNSELAESIYPDPLDWAHSPDVNYLEDFAYDVEAINEGLDEAGYPADSNGVRFTLELTYMSPDANARQIAEVVQASMEDVGIEVDLNGIDNNVYQDLIYVERDFEITVLVGATETDPNLGITIWHECNEEGVHSRNPSGHCDEELDELAEQAMRAVGEDERGEYLQQFEERAAEVMVSAPIAHVWGLNAYNQEEWDGAELPTRNIPIDWHEIRPTE